jgi:hypothetical protein
MKQAFKGKITNISILRGGIVVREYPEPQSNLLLNQGLDAIATNALCDIFNTCIKGTGSQTPTSTIETDLHYSITLGSKTVTAGSGASYTFTNADVGKYLLFTGSGVAANSGGTITAYISGTQVTIDTPAPVAITNKSITLFNVALTNVDNEENITTLTDTFTCAQGSGSLSSVGNRFTNQMVGQSIWFPQSQQAFQIEAYTSATQVTISPNAGIAINEGTCYVYPSTNGNNNPDSRTQTYGAGSGQNGTATTGGVRVFTRTFVFLPCPQMETAIANTNTYSTSGTTVTQTAGARPFTSGDVGSYIHFVGANYEAKITAYTDASHVTIDVAPASAITNDTINLYGFATYSAIAFSNSYFPGPNANILVALASPVNVMGSTPLKPGEQLQVTYQFQVTVSPATSTAGNLNSIINDPGNNMSASGKAGNYCIEAFATSTVNTDGSTNTDFSVLDPVNAGALALSEDSFALSPLGSPIRIANLATTPFSPNPYNSGDYQIAYVGTFQATEALDTKWRSLMLFDTNTNVAIFTFLFTYPQTKSSSRIFSMTLTKSWSRDFS